MKIGNFETENNVFLAPMAGVTDLPFRKICRRYGAGLVYSEMVSAKGLYYNDKKTADLMRIDDEERPCAIQIFGSDADIMADPSGTEPKIKFYFGVKGTSLEDAAEKLEKLKNAIDRKSTRLNSSHVSESRMPSSA